ncbi:MAG: hypothetical protein ACLFPS_02870 [Clostridia bacterium]
MRTLAADPNSRENFVLSYKIASMLVKRHHLKNRLRLLSYIDKTQGYYTIYLSQDPASPLSTSFGFFNVSLGNFRSMSDNELYYYFNDYKDGVSETEIVEKIESMINLSYSKGDETPEDNDYFKCIDLVSKIAQAMLGRENGFAIENEICPFIGPYSRVPDNQLWFELQEITGKEHQQRCNYDYFVVGTGVPGGPVYRAWAFLSNEGTLYLRDNDSINILEDDYNFEDILDKILSLDK